MRLTLTHCPIDPRRALVALFVCAAFLLMAAKVKAGPLGIVTPRGEPGPVRQLIQARPGVLIPHLAAAPGCSGCQSAPNYTPAPAPAEPIDDRQISYDPRPAVAQAGVLVTSTGRVLVLNGDGTYSDAGTRPAAPAAFYTPPGLPRGSWVPATFPLVPQPSCPNGRCPLPVK